MNTLAVILLFAAVAGNGANAPAKAVRHDGRALPPASEWACEEVTNHLAMMLGKGGSGPACLPRFEMVLPGDVGAEDFAADFAALRDTDGYAVRRRGDAICFVADNPKGHVNGVHRWLERNFEIVWPRPKGGMCFFGRADAAAIESADCDYRDIPAFRLRYLGSSNDPETWRWKVRNADSGMLDFSRQTKDKLAVAERLGMFGAFCDVFGGGHDMESRWFPRKEFFRDHPEYWMLVDGKRWEGRRSNFCETNPGFVEAFSRSVEEKIRDLPKSVRVISINMEDQGLTCECDKCLAPIALGDGSVVDKGDPAFRSTRFFIFFNQVARHVAKVRPDLRILQFAYMHLAVPPKVKVEDNVTLKFCPYPRNMRYSIVEGAVNSNWKDRLDGWLANTRNIYLREYYFCGCIFYPRPVADGAALDLRYCRERGVGDVYSDLAGRCDGPANNPAYGLNRPYSEFYDMVGVEAWTICKLFWDPSLDPRELRAKYLRLSFGPAAADVAEFYRLLRESWYSDSMASGFSDNPFRSAAHYIVERGIADKCRAALAAAAAKADCTERREWIADMRRILEDWIREAPNFTTGELEVPRIAAEDPGFDFDDGGAWTKAARLPAFRQLRGKKGEDRSGSCTRIFSDGRAFLVGFDVRTKAAPRALTAVGRGNFPRGDKIELSFSSERDGYYQFAFDCDGNRYEAKGLDATWDCEWDVRIEKGAFGWKAVVRIPFDSIGFAPHINPRVRFLPMVTIEGCGESGGRQLLSWQSGVSHAPVSWGELTVSIE